MKTATAPSVPDLLAWQDEQIRMRQFEFIGMAWAIVLEAARGAAVPQPSVTDRMGTRLEWYGEPGIPIAQTLDHSTLLLLDAVRMLNGNMRNGPVGLPDIPDPTWRPPMPKPEEIQNLPAGKHWMAPEAPKIPQRLEDRARGMLKQTDFMIFGPVQQILIRPEGLAEGWIAECGGEIGAGTQMELLIDRKTGKAHFYGGRYQISRIG